MKIFEPKPPPTSGAMTRSLCSGASPMERRNHQPRHMRILARGVKRIVIGPRIIGADGGARFHGIWNEPVVDEVKLGDMRG